MFGFQLSRKAFKGPSSGHRTDEKGKPEQSFTSIDARTCSSDTSLHRSAKPHPCQHAALTDANGIGRNQKLALENKNRTTVYLLRELTAQ